MNSPKPKPLRVAAFGATGSGKTQWTKRYLREQGHKRLMTWDYKHDPGLVDVGQPVHDLGAFVRALRAKAFNVRYMVDHEQDIDLQFKVFCQAAWLAAWEGGDVCMFVDELPEVTKSNKAPAAWRKCVNVGREFTGQRGDIVGISIVGSGQRATECDKSFVTNCDIVHCGRLGWEDDAKAMAKTLRVPALELMDLPDLHWVEKRQGETQPRRGVLTFGNEKPPQKSPPAKKTTARPRLKKAP